MNPIQFIFALVRVYLPIPADFKTEVESTYAEASEWYRQLATDHWIKKFFSTWYAKTLLLFLILPVGREIKKMGNEPVEKDKDLEELLKKLSEGK